MNTTWSEATTASAQTAYSTYANAHETATIDTYAYTSSSTTADFDVTSYVAGVVAGTQVNNGMMIITDSPRSDQAAASDWWGGLWTYWKSSEYTTVSERPKLTIEYTTSTPVSAGFASRTSLAVTMQQGTMKINMPEAQTVSVDVFTVSGRHILSVDKCQLNAGANSLALPKGMGKGLFLLKISGEKVHHNQRIILQ